MRRTSFFRKTAARAFALFILTCLFVGALPGCSSDSLAGHWLSEEIDFSVEFNGLLDQGIASAESADRSRLLELMKVESFPVRVEYYFGEDGQWFVQFDQASCKKTVSDAKAAWKEKTVGFYEERLARTGEYATVDELFEAEGMDVDSFVKAVISQYLEELIGTNAALGRYKTDGDMIIAEYESEDGEIAWNGSFGYTLDGDSLTLDEPSSTDGTPYGAGGTVEYPLKLTRSAEDGK
ncbi:MAG: hypothetical protein IJT70_05220 [Clostridia bacterium]|nr:hypothetical protein [Clostridia bacterium]